MNKIIKIDAREIMDSRGNPTVEVELLTEKGSFIDSAPSGVSTGTREALEKRDGGDRLNGKGVLENVKIIEERLSKELEGMDCEQQEEIDKKLIELDGTENKSNFGANTIMPISLAVARAGAKGRGVELYEHLSQLSGNSIKMPSPCFNVINGGRHAGNGLAIQEFMINFEQSSFKDNYDKGIETYQKLKEVIENKYGKDDVNVGDEGGFAPDINLTTEALDLLMETGGGFNIFLDCAASEFFKEGKYIIDGKEFDKDGLVGYYKELLEKYPLKSFEDPFSEDDGESFKLLLGDAMVVGDDLTTTNPSMIEKYKDCCNCLLLKINQIGTVTEAIKAANLAKSYNWKIIVSHRSGETTDDFIADFAVGIGAEHIKSGAPARGERIAKYNRLLRIEEQL